MAKLLATTKRQLGGRSEDCRKAALKGEMRGSERANIHESTRKGRRRGAALGQAKLALRFQIHLQASLHGIVKTHRPLAERMALLGRSAAEDGSAYALARLWTLVARPSTHSGGHYRGQALIVDIQGGRRGSAEIGRIIDGKIIKNHTQAAGRPLGRLP